MLTGPLEKLESLTNSLKNIFTPLAVIILVIIFYPQLKTFIKSSELESIEISGIKIKKLSKELNNLQRVKGEEDVITSELTKAVADVIDSKGTFWVYLGSTPRGQKGNWLTKYFIIEAVPEVGDPIEAKVDVFKRSDKPKLVNGEWSKADIVGLVKRGEKVVVKKIVDNPGTENRSLWWAQVIAK